MTDLDVVLLDGPMGTELDARGVPVSGAAWSAQAIEDAPETIAAIHRDYAAAGATVHTANTFRTTPRAVGSRWRPLMSRAVALARSSVPSHHRVAGSIAPLEDCYRPDLSPPAPRTEHRRLARQLAELGVDLILVETFPHVGEALIALEEALATGLETWLSLTPGYQANLLTKEEITDAANRAADTGVHRLLINCVPAEDALPLFLALREGAGRVPLGLYCNAGPVDGGLGWGRSTSGAERYATLAQDWMASGATVVGGCCGTGPSHLAAIREKRRGSPSILVK